MSVKTIKGMGQFEGKRVNLMINQAVSPNYFSGAMMAMQPLPYENLSISLCIFPSTVRDIDGCNYYGR